MQPHSIFLYDRSVSSWAGPPRLIDQGSEATAAGLHGPASQRLLGRDGSRLHAMQMNGQQRIAASRQQVWQAQNDPDVLRQCIPGCQSLEKEADDRLRATAEIKIGPIGARFNGAVTLSDLDPPNGYTITGEGQGGTVGFAKGGAKVRLADDGPGSTLLSYDVDAQVGGRLA